MNAAADLARKGVAVDIIGIWGVGGPSEPCHEVERELRAHPLVRIIGPKHMYHYRYRLLTMPQVIGRLLRHQGLGFTLKLIRQAVRDGEARLLAQAAALSRARYDMVHCHFATVGPLAIQMRRLGVMAAPVVVHFRGYDITRFIAEHGEDVYAQVFAEADWFIANCQAFADRAVALGCPADRIDIISSGLDLAAFPFQPRPAREDGPLRLLGVGRLVEKKGFHIAVEAMSLLKARGVDAKLKLIGDGEERARLEALIARHGLEDRVELAGAKPHSSIARHLAEADELLAPCVTAANGDQDAPVNTIKEAMASGTLVIGSRCGGIPEIVEDGANGWLCAEGDAESLADAIGRMLSEAIRWDEIRRAARLTVEQHHSLDLATRKTLEVYAKARGHRLEATKL